MRTAISRAAKIGLMLVLVAGLAMSGLALAQTEGDSTDETTESAEDAGPRFHRRGGHVVGTAADVIGIEVADLIEALQEDGATLVSVAEANGSSGDAIVAAVVEQLTERLDEAVAEERLTQEEADEKLADATERIQELVETENPQLRGGPGRGHGARSFGIALADVADLLGLTTDELRAAAQHDTTLAELAEQQGVPTDDVIATLVAPVEERLQAAVDEERITQEEADEKLADATERATELVETGEGLCGGPGGRRGFGPRGPGGFGGTDTGFAPAAGQALLGA